MNLNKPGWNFLLFPAVRFSAEGRADDCFLWQRLLAVEQHGSPICLTSALGDIRKGVADRRGMGQVGYILEDGWKAWLLHG